MSDSHRPEDKGTFCMRGCLVYVFALNQWQHFFFLKMSDSNYFPLYRPYISF